MNWDFHKFFFVLEKSASDVLYLTMHFLQVFPMCSFVNNINQSGKYQLILLLLKE